MLGLTQYLRIGALALVVLLFPLGYIKGCSDEKERFDAYKEMVAAVGKAQEERTAARIAHDNLLKEEANEENRLAHDRLRAALGELRRERARSRELPPAPAGSKCPDGQICFDRSEYQRAYGALLEEVRRLADEGSEVTIDLDTAKTWARSLKIEP